GFGPGGFGPPSGGGGFGPGGKKAPDVVYQWKGICLDRSSGKVVWGGTANKSKPKLSIHQSNTIATQTPTSDGERIYTYFGTTGIVFCYDRASKQLWKKDLGAHSMMFGHGTASSPVVDDGRVFVQCDNEEKSFLVALEAKTGTELWKVTRPERTGWST